jgi:hypothetical protein
VVRSQKWGQIFAQIIRGQIFYPYLTRIIRPWDYDGYLFGGGGYKYPFFLLGLGSKRVYLTSIVDFESLPSFLHSSHNSCIFFREKREEI